MVKPHTLVGKETARASLNAQHAVEFYRRNNAEQQRMMASDGQAGTRMAEWCSCYLVKVRAGLRRELRFVRVYVNMKMLLLMIAAAAPHERGRR